MTPITPSALLFCMVILAVRDVNSLCENCKVTIDDVIRRSKLIKFCVTFHLVSESISSDAEDVINYHSESLMAKQFYIKCYWIRKSCKI